MFIVIIKVIKLKIMDPNKHNRNTNNVFLGNFMSIKDKYIVSTFSFTLHFSLCKVNRLKNHISNMIKIFCSEIGTKGNFN